MVWSILFFFFSFYLMVSDQWSSVTHSKIFISISDFEQNKSSLTYHSRKPKQLVIKHVFISHVLFLSFYLNIFFFSNQRELLDGNIRSDKLVGLSKYLIMKLNRIEIVFVFLFSKLFANFKSNMCTSMKTKESTEKWIWYENCRS